jgi:Ca2+-binding RTX toxin-like protein
VTTGVLVTEIQPDDVQLAFEAVIVDGDGNESAYNFNVGIDAQGSTVGSATNNVILGTSGNDTISAVTTDAIIDGGTGNDILNGSTGNDILIGGSGDDTLTGGAGNDIMTGGTGADVFKWSLNETGHDTIKDFNSSGASFNLGEGDKLDLRDLIQNNALTSDADLASFLHFESDANSNLVMKIDPNGATNGFAATQSVTLEGVTLSALSLADGATNEAIIHALRTSLKVDGDA